jgi:hypothetical protein
VIALKAPRSVERESERNALRAPQFGKFRLLTRSRDSKATRNDAAPSPLAKERRICSRKRLAPATHASIACIDARKLPATYAVMRTLNRSKHA